MLRLAFENPWPLAILLLLAAAVVVGVATRTGRGKLLLLGAALLLLAAMLFLLDALVETPAEQVTALVGRLAAAAQASDPAPIIDALSRTYNHGGFDRDRLAAAVRRELGLYHARAVAVNGLEATGDEHEATTRFVVVTSGVYAGYAVNHYALRLAIFWRREEGQWRIVGIRRFEPFVATDREMPLLAK